MIIIKGDWRGNEDQVNRAQHGRFIFINSNGSRWAGEEPGDIAELLDVLGKEPLDPSFEAFGNFISVNPCSGVINPEYGKVVGAEKWIDGPRIFDVEGVVHFFGNFYHYSHVFGIYTNDPETIDKLTAAIRANQERANYKGAKQ